MSLKDYKWFPDHLKRLKVKKLNKKDKMSKSL